MTEGGKCYNTRQCCIASKVFDPFYLKEANIEEVKLHVDNLKYFELPEFDDDFLKGLKGELVKAKLHAEKYFDWTSLENKKSLYDRGEKARLLRSKRAKVRMDTDTQRDTAKADAESGKSRTMAKQSETIGE